jgi:fructose-bisphosphate aldolase class II
MHQDHGTSPKVCQGAIDLGFGSVMMDGSLMEDGKTPSSFDYNVEVTRKVVDMAHKVGVTVEGELGCLGNLETGEAGEEDGIGAEGKLDHSQMLTDPEEAAPSSRPPSWTRWPLPSAPATALTSSAASPRATSWPSAASRKSTSPHPNTHLVMHGSSSVPQELLAIINQYGGKMKETYGVPVEEIQEAIKHGVRKINIDTDIRLAMTGAVRKFLFENPDKFDAREWLKPAREAAKPFANSATWSLAAKARVQDQGPQPAGGGGSIRLGCVGTTGELISDAGPQRAAPEKSR